MNKPKPEEGPDKDGYNKCPSAGCWSKYCDNCPKEAAAAKAEAEEKNSAGKPNVAIDRCHMIHAKRAAMLSADTTKIGVTVVGKSLVILVTGYNCFPDGVKRTEVRTARPAKYDYTEHAERVAIYTAARKGVALDGSTMYISGLRPCKECARAIVISGIKTLVLESLDIPESKDGHSWGESMRIGAQILKEGGVTVRTIQEEKV